MTLDTSNSDKKKSLSINMKKPYCHYDFFSNIENSK